MGECGLIERIEQSDRAVPSCAINEILTAYLHNIDRIQDWHLMHMLCDESKGKSNLM